MTRDELHAEIKRYYGANMAFKLSKEAGCSINTLEKIVSRIGKGPHQATVDKIEAAILRFPIPAYRISAR